MKSLKGVIIWKVVAIALIVFTLSSFVIVYLIEKKAEEQILPNLEYIRDSKYKSLNKENVRTAFDFSSLKYTTYIIDKSGVPLFDVKLEVDNEVKTACQQRDDFSQKYSKNGIEKYIAIKKNGDLCLVVEGNANSLSILASFSQQLMYMFGVFFTALLSIILGLAYRKIVKPIRIVTENAEKAMVGKYGELKTTDSQVSELVSLEKYSTYIIDLLKRRNSGGYEEILNVTERKQEVEQKYNNNKASSDVGKFKSAVDASTNMIAILDKHGYINYINQSAISATGISQQSAENKKITTLWHTKDNESEWRVKIEEVIKTKKPIKFLSLGVLSNGNSFEGEIIMSPIVSSEGIVEGILYAERDITEEKQKERIKTEFISVVSHELRTPMTVIRGYSSLLSDGTLGTVNEKQKEYIDKINSETGKLLELANDMLDLQKFESGKVELKMSSMQLEPIVKKLVDGFIETYSKKGLKLSYENHAEFSSAFIDQKYFERVITNLLSNAYKYTEKGEVTVFTLNPDEVHIVVAVKDTGVGIPETALNHLFERFYQVDGVMQRKQEGSGLGLSIVKKIIDAHDGMVWVESELGKGSTFYVALPKG